MKIQNVILAVTMVVAAFVSTLQTHAQSLIYGLTTTNSLVVFSTNGAVATGPIITGLGVGETAVAIDFRPFTGALYALTADGANTGRLYIVNPVSGAATIVALTGALTNINTGVGMDFNPLAASGVNALRIVTGARDNYRVTFSGAAATVNYDSKLNTTNVVAGTNAVAAAYTSNRGGLPGAGGAGSTTLYVIDEATASLYVQNPPNNGTLVDAKPISAGFSPGTVAGLDIDTLNNRAYGIMTPGDGELVEVNLATGGVQFIRTIPFNVTDLAITLPVAIPPTLIYGLTTTNTLVTFGTDTTNVSAALPITGLGGGETAVAIDFRPLNGALYVLTRDGGNVGRLYTVNLFSGSATAVALTGSSLTLTGSVGMDFNPIALAGQNALRIVTGSEQNFRLTFAASPATVIADGAINVTGGASGTNVIAAGYVNNRGGLPGAGGAGGTTLYVIDSDTDTLYVQNPPNNGTLVSAKPLALDIGSVGGLDVITAAGPVAPEHTIAALAVGGDTGLYSIDFAQGFANFIRDLPDTIVDLAAPIPATLSQIGNPPGTNVTVQLSGSGGPFTITRANNIIDPWCTVTTVANGPVTLLKDGPRAFYRARDVSSGAPTRFTALLNGTAAGTGVSGFGFATAELNGSTFTYEVAYSGLTGVPNLYHVHLPAPTTGSAGVAFDLMPVGGLGTTGRFSATRELTLAERTAVLAGQAYFNIHTPTHGGGEIRGQIVPVAQKVVMTGVGERPNANSSPAFGMGAVTIVGTNLGFHITYQGLVAPATLAHFHGPADSAGVAPPIIDIGTGAFGPLGSSGTLTGKVVLTPAQLAAFADGKVYVNIHSGTFPGGEIRGQVSPYIAERPFSAELTGAAEKPTSVNSPGSGFIEGSLIGDSFSFLITYRGMTSAITAAHIHGPATSTVPAGVLIDLQPYHRGPYAQQGVFRGCVTLTPAAIAALLNGDLYVNLHTAVNPSGEIRGQLAHMVFQSAMNGANERPTPNASPATGYGFIGLVGRQVSIGLHYRDLSGSIANAHYHGPADVNGSAGVLVGITFKPSNIWGFLFDASTLNDANVGHFVDGLVYVNIHSPAPYTGGEIRGQVVP